MQQVCLNAFQIPMAIVFNTAFRVQKKGLAHHYRVDAVRTFGEGKQVQSMFGDIFGKSEMAILL